MAEPTARPSAQVTPPPLPGLDRLLTPVRRVTARAPERPIRVGVWPANDEILKDERLRPAAGAGHDTNPLRETNSPRETVETCVAVAHRKVQGSRASDRMQASA